MKERLTFFVLLIGLVLIGCEKNVQLSPRVSRFIASEDLLKIDGKENLAKGVKELLNEEQNLNNKELWESEALSLNINPKFIPENNPKFPLPYYLVPEEDVKYTFADSLDPQVADQLSMRISGKKHFKLFIHPESEVAYDFLRASYNYVGPDQTEFYASPSSSYRTLIVWNRNNIQRKPFIAKVSLEKKTLIKRVVSANEIALSIANQKALDRIGKKKLNDINVKFFPESAGLTIIKSHPGSPSELGGELIREIPDEIFNGQKKWHSLSALMSSNKNQKPIIMEIIKQSGLTSYDFLKTYMIDNYLGMFEELSFKQGINFEPGPQNLYFETTPHLKPTGKWVLHQLAGLHPDVLTMAKNQGPLDVYMESANAAKYNLRNGRSSFISSYVFFYKHQVFDSLLNLVAKNDPSITPAEIQTLQESIDAKYTSLINSYLKLNLKSAPNLTNYKNIEELLITQTELESKLNKKEIKDEANIKTFVANKKARQEWVLFAPQNGKSEYYLTDHGLYEVSNKKVVALSLFNKDEFEDYKINNKMLPNLIHYGQTPHDKTSCFGIATDFVK